MPASMISAGAGSSPKVNGSSMATVATGPMPGSTPTSVPRKQPMKQYRRFCQLSATPSPNARLFSVSIRRSRTRPQRQWQPEQPHEHADREHDHDRGERQRLQRAHLARGLRPDQHQHGDRGDEPEPLQRDPEQHDSEQRESDRARVKARHPFAVGQERAQRDDRAESGQQSADQGGEHGGPHAVQVAKAILLRQQDKAAADRDEDQPRPEILRRPDAHYAHWLVMPAKAGIQYPPSEPFTRGRAPYVVLW